MNVRLLSEALSRNQQTQYSVRQQMASGRRVNQASDDPGAYESIQNLTSDLAQLAQYQRNADMANHYLSMADQGMESAYNITHEVNDLAVRASDGTLDAETRKAMAQQVDELLVSFIGVANSAEGGRFTFAGLRTDTKPFVEQYDPVDGRIIGVTYAGSLETRMIKTGQERYAATNIPGASESGEGGVFQTQTRDLFDSIIQLRDALEAGDNPAGTGIGERLAGDLSHLLTQASLNGARQEQVLLQKTSISDMQLTSMRSLDALQSVDMAEASMRLSQADTAYQAALYSTSNLMKQVSLLNYM